MSFYSFICHFVIECVFYFFVYKSLISLEALSKLSKSQLSRWVSTSQSQNWKVYLSTTRPQTTLLNPMWFWTKRIKRWWFGRPEGKEECCKIIMNNIWFLTEDYFFQKQTSMFGIVNSWATNLQGQTKDGEHNVQPLAKSGYFHGVLSNSQLLGTTEVCPICTILIGPSLITGYFFSTW